MQVVETSYDGQTPLVNNFRRYPVALGLIAICVVVFLLFYQLRVVSLLSLLNFVPFEVSLAGTQFAEPGDWWRFVTPIFLHFGWTHLVFNSLWVWEFGRRIEGRLGGVNFLGLVLVSAVVSNIAQYMVTGPSVFGGMSGVVYALLGFIWAGNWVHPRWLEPVPPALLGFMLVWLLVGLTGALSFLGLGAIANGAHFGGLIAGVICGAGIGLATRLAKH